MKIYYVYILTSKKNGTLYIGITNNISQRIFEHQNNLIPGFSSKYAVNLLVHIEQFITVTQAIKREKQLKTWKRQWKIELIEQCNPDWIDLSKHLL